MRKMLLALAAVATLAVGSQVAFAEEACSGSGTPLPRSAIESRLKAEGYTTIREIKLHHGCYEAKGIDQAGNRFELEINSFTGKIVNQEE